MRISDWSSDVCSSDLTDERLRRCQSLVDAFEIARRGAAIDREQQIVGGRKIVVHQRRRLPDRRRHLARADRGITGVNHHPLGRIENREACRRRFVSDSSRCGQAHLPLNERKYAAMWPRRGWPRRGRNRWPCQFNVHACTFRRSHVERSEEHTSELQSLMRISYAVFCLKKKKNTLTKKQ